MVSNSLYKIGGTMMNFKKELEKLGFELWNTGGNCEAMGLLVNEVEILVTDDYDHTVNFTDKIAVGVGDQIYWGMTQKKALELVKTNIEWFGGN